MAIYGNTLYSIDESILFNVKDIYYNKDKFDSGEINLCFVTGFSGSGKSTMADGMTNVHSIELDDIVNNYNFSDDNLKEYDDAIYKYFTTVGKEFRLSDRDTNKSMNYRSMVTRNIRTFIKFIMQYAELHKKAKYVVNGIQIYCCYSPTELPFKDYAVYIKGTSKIVSSYRATKRDVDNDEEDGEKVPLKDKIKMFNQKLKNIKEESKYFNEWYKYFRKLII